MTIERYFIKDNYVPNEEAVTRDEVSGKQYWNKSSIYSSYYYQFPVYQYAQKLIQEREIKEVIDVGCGTGAKLSLIHKGLPEVNFIGIDQKPAIDYCKNFIPEHAKLKEEELNDAMINENWVYYATFSSEGESVRVEKSTLDPAE